MAFIWLGRAHDGEESVPKIYKDEEPIPRKELRKQASISKTHIIRGLV